MSVTFLVLLLAGLASCGDQPVDPVIPMPSEIPAPPAPPVPPPTPPAVPAGPAGLMLDSAALRALGQQPLVPGERVLIAADSSNARGLRESAVDVRDTTIAEIDGEGMLYGLTVGQTWVTWATEQASDSALLTVAAPGETVSNQHPFIAPIAPKKTVDVRYPVGRARGAIVNKTWRVGVGGDLQAALNNAQPGDEVVLASGATFTGNYVLPPKLGTGSDWIIVRAEVFAVGAGTRITPALAAGVARVVTPNQDAAIRAGPGARRWRLVGFEVAHAQNAIYNYGIVVLGAGNEKSLALQPTDIILDRMYIHGSTTAGSSRCIAFNGRALAVVDSWISECHAKGNDAQGVAGWNGGGPFLIENNFIEASGEGILFGGADPFIVDVSPSDIIIRRNHLYKPLSWARGKWTIKATFELKHARRVIFENNVLENHWIDGQTGFAILLQTLADNNSSWAWTTVQDVLIQNNVIKNSTSGANVAARVAYNGGTLPTYPTSRVAFINNLWIEVGKDPITGEEGRLMQLLGDLSDLTVLNNTFTLSQGQAQHVVTLDGRASTRTTVVNNVFPASNYGIFGSSKGSGTAALSFYAPDGVVKGNVIPKQQSSAYPANNYFPLTGVPGVRLTDPFGAGCAISEAWRLLVNVPLTTGVDCARLDASLKRVESIPPE